MSSPFIASFALFIQIAGFRCCCEEWESIPPKWWVDKLRNESAQLLCRTKAAQRLQSCGRVHRSGVGAFSGNRAGVSSVQRSKWNRPPDCRTHNNRAADRSEE